MNPYTVLVPRGFHQTGRSFTSQERSPDALGEQISRLAFKAVEIVEGAFSQIIRPREKPHA